MIFDILSSLISKIYDYLEIMKNKIIEIRKICQ